MHPHERFHTAVVIAGELRVDVATARTEHYEYPAALPVVEHSSIRRDLHRRDFTINSMAIAVDAATFGLLLDPFGGRADLEAGALRVLHNLSFIEDPTRIFRAVRYETRYGFAMEPHTLELARNTVAMGLVGEVSGARLRDELLAILEDPRAPRGARADGPAGSGRALHPALDCSRETIELIERVDLLRADSPAGARALAGAVCGDRPGCRGRRAGAVAGVAADPPPRRPGGRLGARCCRRGCWRRSRAAATPADVAELLAPQPLEVAIVCRRARLGRRRSAYLEGGAAVTLELDGDVAAAGVRAGPLAAGGGGVGRAPAAQAKRADRRSRAGARGRSGDPGGGRVTTIRWDAHRPASTVVFTGRTGGVSEGAFASLNLGALTDDEPRRCGRIAAAQSRRPALIPNDATMAWQVAGAEVREVTATPSVGSLHAAGAASRFPSPTGWSPRCPPSRWCCWQPIACRSRSLAPTARGWPCCTRGGRACWPASASRESARWAAASVAMVGPGAGPCCYEVKDDVGQAAAGGVRRSRPCGTGAPTCGTAPGRPWSAPGWSTSRWPVDARSVARRSTSRTGAIVAAPAARGWSVSLVPDPAVIAANLARIRSEIGPEVEILAATKYVDTDGMQALAGGRRDAGG